VFAGEAYLLEAPPDYESERQSFVVKLILAFVFRTLILPLFLAKEEPEQENAPKEINSSSTKTATTAPSRKKDGKKKCSPTESKTVNSDAKFTSNTDSSTAETVNIIFCSLCFVAHTIYLWLFASPDNAFGSRTVFETLLFTSQEC
jgi:hypothetical protein